MTQETNKRDWPSTCPLCGSKLGEHHAKDCKHWGQVLPSEVPGLLERAMAEVLKKEPKRHV